MDKLTCRMLNRTLRTTKSEILSQNPEIQNWTRNPKLGKQLHVLKTRFHTSKQENKPETRNPNPEINPKPEKRNLKPEPRNPKLNTQSTETKFESGTSQSKRGTSVELSNIGEGEASSSRSSRKQKKVPS